MNFDFLLVLLYTLAPFTSCPQTRRMPVCVFLKIWQKKVVNVQNITKQVGTMKMPDAIKRKCLLYSDLLSCWHFLEGGSIRIYLILLFVPSLLPLLNFVP